jgi:hypothetical protein
VLTRLADMRDLTLEFSHDARSVARKSMEVLNTIKCKEWGLWKSTRGIYGVFKVNEIYVYQSSCYIRCSVMHR